MLMASLTVRLLFLILAAIPFLNYITENIRSHDYCLPILYYLTHSFNDFEPNVFDVKVIIGSRNWTEFSNQTCDFLYYKQGTFVKYQYMILKEKSQGATTNSILPVGKHL